MPIYEYQCVYCGVTSSFLLLRATEEINPYCKACGSKDVVRIISRVSVSRSEEKRIGGLLDPSKFSNLDENDPGSIERVMNGMVEELGDEMGEGFREHLEESLCRPQDVNEEPF